MRVLDLVRYDVLDLTADRYVTYAALLDHCCLQEVVRVKSDLVVQENNKLAGEPLFHFLPRLTDVLAFAPFELDNKLLGFLRIVIAPDDQVFLIHALELFPISLHFGEGRFEDRVDCSIWTICEAKLLIRTKMVIQWA